MKTKFSSPFFMLIDAVFRRLKQISESISLVDSYIRNPIEIFMTTAKLPLAEAMIPLCRGGIASASNKAPSATSSVIREYIFK